SPGVRLILREQKDRRCAIGKWAGRQTKSAQADVLAQQRSVFGSADEWLWPAALARSAPRPGVTKPQRRQDVEQRRLRTPVCNGDPNQHIVWRSLGVFREDIEVAPVVEDAGVRQLELAIQLVAASVFCNQSIVGKLRLGVFVKTLHVGVRGRGI